MEQFMRIVSWMVIGASVTALAWTGVNPLLDDAALPAVNARDVVGTVASQTAQVSFEVRQPVQLAQADDNVVALFRGSESRTTPEFEVEAPWIIDWRVTSREGFELAVDVSLERAGTGVHVGNVLMTKGTGNGVRLFEEGGRFYFRVNSSFANWSLKVIQLTPDEAEAYTPIGAED